MEISRYLAMTPAEMEAAVLPPSFRPAYMACHFALGNPGLSNIPQTLPQGCLLILDDQTPIAGHDPERILSQLTDIVQRFACSGVLLDFERKPERETGELCRLLAEHLPVAMPPDFIGALKCPVFLPPCPPDKPLTAYIAPWKDREIWLDAAVQMLTLELTETGCTSLPQPWQPIPDNAFTDNSLHCRYRAQVLENRVRFHLWRDKEQLENLITDAEHLGVSRVIGLYQEYIHH